VLLIALSFIPTAGGIVRLANVARDASLTADNARFLEAPAPVVVHVVSATVYCLLGAFQFSPRFRRRWPAVHRNAGVLLALCGLSVGVTGLWMTASYSIPQNLQGPVLYGVRLVVSSAMIASILIAWWSIVRRDATRHEAFMIRAYALGHGAGTQALVLLPWMLLSGETGGLTRDLLMTLAWVINGVVAESIIRSRTRLHRWSRRVSNFTREESRLHGVRGQ
jgi:hypothetical protein